MRPGFSRWGLPVICLAGACWAFSFGVGTQLGTHWLKDHGASDTVIGLNHATYYFGLTLGSLLSSRLCGAGTCVGHRWADSVRRQPGLFPLGGGWPGWFTWRLVNGLASALSCCHWKC